MDQTTPSPPKGEDRKGSRTAPKSYDALNAGELFWQPYRSMSRALLQTHQNLAIYLEINRNLADEMQTILRRAQEMVVELSDRRLRRATEPSASRTEAFALSLPEVEEMYSFAIEGVRELGRATVAAQIRSLETMRDHARNALNRG